MRSASIATQLRRPGVQTIMLALATGLSQLLTALISVVVARSVEASALGLATIAMSVSMVAVGLLDFGSNQLWLRDYARWPERRPEMAQRLLSKLAVAAVACTLGFAVLFALPSLRHWWPAALYIFMMLAEQTLQVPLRARARVPLVSASMFINRLAAFGFVLVLGALGMGAMRLVVALALGSLVACVVLWFGGAGGDLREASRGFASPWKGSTHYGLYSLTNTFQALDAPLLGFVANPAQVGLYGAINRWTAPINLLGGAFSSASIPHVAAAGNLHRGWRAIRKSAVLLAGALAVVLLTAVLAGPAVRLLLGPGYEGAAPALQVLALAMGVVIFNQPAAMLLQATGHERAVSLALPVSVVVQLGSIFYFAPRYGAVGASLAMLLAQLVLAAFLAVFLVRLWRHESRPRRGYEVEEAAGPAPRRSAS